MIKKIKRDITPLSLWFYIITWLLFVYLFFQIFNFKVEQSDNLLLRGMYFIEFGVHEASHLIATGLPQILIAAAGFVVELLFVVLILVATLKARSYFASVFVGLWVMFSMNCIGRYMSDARVQILPLIGPGNNPQHDWHYIFSYFGWLNLDTTIGSATRYIGDLIGILALVFGLWLIIYKIRQIKTP